jgi:hypothetical protein
LWNNYPDNFYPNDFFSSYYSDIQNGLEPGINGNIDEDPLFADTVFYYLSGNSPCVDSGSPDIVFNDPEDPNNLGFALWPAQGSLRNDMGAYGGNGWIPIANDVNEDDLGKLKLPTQFSLSQNYPNPFNPTTTIEFALPKSEFVTLKIYNLLGQEVTELVAKRLTAGNYKYTWDAGSLSSGVYYYKIEAGSYIQARKLILLK